MISERQIQEILTQYKKHGWILRRVLISAETRANLSATVFENAEISLSEIEALWFSRLAKEGRETWELRHLSGSPFALVEVFEADDDEEVREEARQEMQTRLFETASKHIRRQ